MIHVLLSPNPSAAERKRYAGRHVNVGRAKGLYDTYAVRLHRECGHVRVDAPHATHVKTPLLNNSVLVRVRKLVWLESRSKANEGKRLGGGGPIAEQSPSALVLSRTPGHLVRRAQQAHTAIWAGRLHGELTGPQYAALVVLAIEPGIDQSRLGQRASLDKNTAGDVVRRLAAHGWVERSVDPSDARRRLLRLTTSARSALRYITPAADQVQQDLLEPLEEVSRERFTRLMSVVARTADIHRAGRREPDSIDLPVLQLPSTPGFLLRRVQQVHATLWAECVGGGVTAPQYAVLAALTVSPGSDQATVGRLASLDKSSVAEVVGRLVRDGWVQRSAIPGDSRRQSLRHTERTDDLLSRTTPLVESVQEQLLAPLGPSQAHELVDLLATVAYRGHRPVDN